MTEEVIVETKNLTKKYKHNTALNNINLKLEKVKFMVLLVKMVQVRPHL